MPIGLGEAGVVSTAVAGTVLAAAPVVAAERARAASAIDRVPATFFARHFSLFCLTFSHCSCDHEGW